MLSVMAAIRLDKDTDSIENTLSLALVDTNSGSAANKATSSLDALASSTWEEVNYCTQKYFALIEGWILILHRVLVLLGYIEECISF